MWGSLTLAPIIMPDLQGSHPTLQGATGGHTYTAFQTLHGYLMTSRIVNERFCHPVGIGHDHAYIRIIYRKAKEFIWGEPERVGRAIPDWTLEGCKSMDAETWLALAQSYECALASFPDQLVRVGLGTDAIHANERNSRTCAHIAE